MQYEAQHSQQQHQQPQIHRGGSGDATTVIGAAAQRFQHHQYQSLQQHQHGTSDDEGDHFLARINEVLGPMVPQEEDPMELFLQSQQNQLQQEERRRRRERERERER